jgi:hypothetical protein
MGWGKGVSKPGRDRSESIGGVAEGGESQPIDRAI